MAEGKFLFNVGDCLRVVQKDKEKHWECIKCHYDYGPVSEDVKMNSMMRERPITELSPWNRYGWVEKAVVREFYCPKCAQMIAVDVQLKGDPITKEMSLDL